VLFNLHHCHLFLLPNKKSARIHRDAMPVLRPFGANFKNVSILFQPATEMQLQPEPTMTP
jgi:hypothetical protein